MILLALDISTSRIGYSIFENEILFKTGFIDLTKIKKDPFSKLDVAVSAVADLIRVYKVTDAVAEAALQKFSFGKSSTSVINLLISFNFALSYAIRNLQIPISHVSFAHARKLTGIQFVKKTSSSEKKELIRQYCEKKYPFLIWEKKKTGKHKDSCYDVSDSIIIGEARIRAVCENKDNKTGISKRSRKSSSQK